MGAFQIFKEVLASLELKPTKKQKVSFYMYHIKFLCKQRTEKYKH